MTLYRVSKLTHNRLIGEKKIGVSQSRGKFSAAQCTHTTTFLLR